MNISGCCWLRGQGGSGDDIHSGDQLLKLLNEEGDASFGWLRTNRPLRIEFSFVLLRAGFTFGVGVG